MPQPMHERGSLVPPLLVAGVTVLLTCGPGRAAGPLTPAEERQTFQLDPGLRIELFASEPMVQDPVAMTFDEAGRLWVVEMRGFMPNVDREGEEERTGRVSVLEDTDGDDRADKATVFLDGLVLPRAIARVKGGVLIAENQPLWFVEIGPDGRAGKKTLIDADYGGTGLPEHSPNGLWRGLDNWYYNAKSRTRYRQVNGQWLSEPTEFRGQWGICHDDGGRLFYNYNWSQLHTDLVPANYLSRNPHHIPATGISFGVATNQQVFPIRPTPAVNRGYIPGVLDDRQRIKEFTSAGAPFIYRGDALPPEYRGNAFVCEPAGNLIKRSVVEEQGLELFARPAGPADREFLASTDERFRPVFLAEGPDGALYVADMYRGLIQHGAYLTPYLREQTLARGLEQPIHRGRIWRITGTSPTGRDELRESPIESERLGAKASNPGEIRDSRSSSFRFSHATSSKLVALLSHPNGWTRDTAQRLLIERGDQSIIPDLRELALQGREPLARLHALWTLEGLGDPDPGPLLPALNDSHPKVQSAAIRVLEQLLSHRRSRREEAHAPPSERKASRDPDSSDGMARLFTELHRLAPTAPLETRLQIALTAGNLRAPRELLLSLLASLITAHADQPLFRDAVLSSLTDLEPAFLQQLWTAPLWLSAAPGQADFLEALASAIVRAGRADDITPLLGLLDTSPTGFNWRQQALLAGIAVHAGRRDYQTVALASQPGILRQAGQFTDRAVRARLEKLPRMFDWPGHQAVKAARPTAKPLTGAQQELFTKGRQLYLVVCAACHGPDGAGLEPQGPPLLDSEWVLGSEERLIRILLHGLEGPISVNGTRYEPPRILTEMPSLAVLDNESLAAVLTYIRREWEHAADPVDPKTVSRLRTSSQGRTRPWTEEELLETGSNQ